mmetsp:Transcript_33838/g.62190  ORF Transcript_33838/g.62190 Transcript_33838/m.62190 type:complete len:424 (-) Transcript_33838:127-1398(-)
MRWDETALHAIEADDPTLTELRISRGFDFPVPGYEVGNYFPTDCDDDDDDDANNNFARLGTAIGNSTHLTTMDFRGHFRNEDVLSDLLARNEDFLEGIKRNTSIVDLKLDWCHLSESASGHAILKAVRESNGYQLTKFSMHQCRFGDEGGHDVLTPVLARCSNLEDVSINSCTIGNDNLQNIITAFGGLPHLERLSFGGSNMNGTAGFQALAGLLRDPNCNLHTLCLVNTGIDDASATILADALSDNHQLKTLNLNANNIGNGGAAAFAMALGNNSSLKELFLGVNRGITNSGWVDIAVALCDPSSINATYSSNHTLQRVANDASDLPTCLNTYLATNSHNVKRQIPMQKIVVQHQDHLDMEPTFEWGLKILPLVVAWLDRVQVVLDLTEDGVKLMSLHKLNAINQFIRAMPADLERDVICES